MADHFADKFWSTKFWSARFFQGGEQNPGSMRASLSGSSSLTAVISRTSGEIVRPPNEYNPFRVFPYEREGKPAFIKARLAGAGNVRPRIGAIGELRAEIETICSVSAKGEARKDFSRVDAVFWFMAA